ncbi:MAG TPA: hypothetical protein VFA83_11060 [Acidimicrobiales bacterium]|nr:hypothetical protein [Acidimicrobiales bacterium]
MTRVLEPLFEAAAERVRIAGDPDCNEAAVAWNEGYYKGICDALSRLSSSVSVSARGRRLFIQLP